MFIKVCFNVYQEWGTIAGRMNCALSLAGSKFN